MIRKHADPHALSLQAAAPLRRGQMSGAPTRAEPRALCHCAGALTGEDAANELLQAEVNAEAAQRLSAATIHTDVAGWLQAAIAFAGEAAAAAAAQPGTAAAQQAGGAQDGELSVGELLTWLLGGGPHGELSTELLDKCRGLTGAALPSPRSSGFAAAVCEL